MGKFLMILGMAGLFLSTTGIAILFLPRCPYSAAFWSKKHTLVCMLYLVSCGLYILGLYLAG
ncbi:MAG: hypothetical protein PWP72_939 [Thermoanaerobacter sp.]|nr:hypothetical protein [Thermoanaerobacter sp.]